MTWVHDYITMCIYIYDMIWIYIYIRDIEPPRSNLYSKDTIWRCLGCPNIWGYTRGLQRLVHRHFPNSSGNLFDGPHFRITLLAMCIPASSGNGLTHVYSPLYIYIYMQAYVHIHIHIHVHIHIHLHIHILIEITLICTYIYIHTHIGIFNEDIPWISAGGTIVSCPVEVSQRLRSKWLGVSPGAVSESLWYALSNNS